ncbi:MAG: hypothetical protein Q9M91_04335 [Candidatus Dojkabacteria bacterium]|nr:hypothetical protein [Candidatus Dojkabacteria bacterium]MDQ7021041.1 hypothetical protein [Candidatus Dojkabacteria bacterium]
MEQQKQVNQPVVNTQSTPNTTVNNSSNVKMNFVLFISIIAIIASGIAIFLVVSDSGNSDNDIDKTEPTNESDDGQAVMGYPAGERDIDEMVVNNRNSGEYNDPLLGNGAASTLEIFEADTYLFDITDLPLNDGDVFYFAIESSFGEKLYSTDQFIYSPNNALVNSEGIAYLEASLETFTYFRVDTPLYIQLYEIVPDSLGNTTEYLSGGYQLFNI